MFKNGKVTYYNSEKGYGFICCFEDKNTIFLHLNNFHEVNIVNYKIKSLISIDRGFRIPQKGDLVTFEVVEGTKGNVAKPWFYTNEYNSLRNLMKGVDQHA